VEWNCIGLNGAPKFSWSSLHFQSLIGGLTLGGNSPSDRHCIWGDRQTRRCPATLGSLAWGFREDAIYIYVYIYIHAYTYMYIYNIVYLFVEYTCKVPQTSAYGHKGVMYIYIHTYTYMHDFIDISSRMYIYIWIYIYMNIYI
jgi:hypothetical protein